jgi:transposase
VECAATPLNKLGELLRAIKPLIARKQTAHGSGLGVARLVVERTFAHLHQFKRLLVRYERRAEMDEAMLALGCCLLCYRRYLTLILQ